MQVNYRPEIDGLRAIAVLSVVLFHLDLPFIRGGFLGVDVFFVISGFLITKIIRHQLDDGKFSFIGFYSRRVRRLVPALLSMLTVSVIVGYFILPPSQMAVLGKTALFSTLSISNILFWTGSGYFDEVTVSNPLLHTWSLSVEEQFYLIWPTILAFWTWRHSRKGLLAFLIGLSAISIILAEWVSAHDQATAFYLLPFRAFELAVGATLAINSRELAWRESRVGAELSTIGGLALIVGSTLLFDEQTKLPGFLSLLPCLGTVLILAGPPGKYSGRLLTCRASIGIGLVSYSMYLVHWPLIVFWKHLFGQEVSGTQAIGLVALTLLLAVVSYFFVERPFRYPRQRTQLQRKFAWTPLAALTVAVLLLSTSAWSSGGWTSRFPASEIRQQLLAGKKFERERSPPARAAMRIAVVGDSHAQRAVEGIREWGVSRGVATDLFYLVGGCAPLLGVSTIGNVEQTEKCEEKRDRTLRQVAQGDYHLVVIAARWGLYTGRVTPMDKIRPRRLTTSPNQRRVSLESSRKLFSVGLKETLSLMQDNSVQVIFVGQVPPIGKDPYPCIETLTEFSDMESICEFASYTDVKNEVAWATQTAVSISEKYPNTSVFDPLDAFCHHEVCEYRQDWDMWYSDGNHLNKQGSRILADGLAPQLSAALINTR